MTLARHPAICPMCGQQIQVGDAIGKLERAVVSGGYHGRDSVVTRSWAHAECAAEGMWGRMKKQNPELAQYDKEDQPDE